MQLQVPRRPLELIDQVLVPSSGTASCLVWCGMQCVALNATWLMEDSGKHLSDKSVPIYLK